MANQISGRIYRVDPLVQIQTKSGEQISKSAIILNTCLFDRYTGEKTYNEFYVKLDVMGQTCDQLFKYGVGDEVIIDFELSPSKLFVDKEGKEDVITHARVINIRFQNPQKNEQQQQYAQSQAQTQQQAPQQPQLYKDPQTGRLFYYNEKNEPVWYQQ